jgi:ferric-dicitrate binding protein FerR (iron transport regulator)
VSRLRDDELLARLSEAARAVAREDADAGAARAAQSEFGPEAWHRLQRERASALARRRWTRPAAVAAGLALVLGAWLARRPRPLTYVVDGGHVEANGYVTNAGDATTELRFSDDTRVRLARGARMSVAGTGPHGARLRVEDGEAHFEVTHRPGADWSVEAGPYRVQVTGTVFDVRWTAGDEAWVALRVGSVRVTGPHLAAPVTLAPGQRLVARLASGAVSLETGGLAAEPRAPAEAPRATPAAPAVAQQEDDQRDEHEQAPARAPRPPRAAPRERVSEPAFAPDGWARRVAGGESAAVLAEARAHVLDDVMSSVDAPALAALADAARYGGQAALSQRALGELRRRFPASAEARTAAFLLGRLADDAGDARGALTWYRRYAQEAPRGPYAAEAFGREMLDVERLDGRAAAAPAARAYLERFPEGTYLLQAREILGLP